MGPPLMIFIIWAVFLLWMLRRGACAVQIEADKNGARLITEEKFANSIVKRMEFRGTKGFGLVETLEMLHHVILCPSLSERLRNLNFEIEAHQIEIRRIRG